VALSHVIVRREGAGAAGPGADKVSSPAHQQAQDNAEKEGEQAQLAGRSRTASQRTAAATGRAKGGGVGGSGGTPKSLTDDKQDRIWTSGTRTSSPMQEANFAKQAPAMASA
jgi:hypothetical protein